MSTFSRSFDLKVSVGPLPPLVPPQDGQQDSNSPRRFASIFIQKREIPEPMDTQSELLSALVPLTKLIAESKVSRSAASAVTAPQTSSISQPKLKRKKRIRPNTERRREQCRNNQARYRKRQRGFVQGLEKSVNDLQDEIQQLNRERHMLCYGIQTKNNIWSVVVEYFRLLRYGFLMPMAGTESNNEAPTADLQDQEHYLRAMMAPDVAFGELCGVEALIDQWQRYSSYFGHLYFQLNRMEQHPVRAMQATATLSLTITEATLRFVFPHLLDNSNEVGDDADERADYYSPLCARLLGQRLDCRCSVRFSWEESGGRVTRLESTMDLLTPLLRVLGNVEDVSYVLKEAVITPEYLIGEIPMRNSNVAECS